MDLLERYLQAVRKHLPWKRQDDILAELRANLESQLEDNEEAIGRPLNDAEVETWLKQLGPPMQVAARYQPQQYLIGPSVFPTYWYILKLTSFWTLAIYIIANAVQIAVGNPTWSAAMGVVLRVPGVLIITAAWVTGVFAALEYAVTHYPGKWQAQAASSSMDWIPSKLPQLEKDLVREKKPRSYAIAVAEIVFSILFLIWLLLLPFYPVLMFGPGFHYVRNSGFTLAPIWLQFYRWIVMLNVFQLGWRIVDLARGAWQQPNRIEQIAMKAFGLIPLAVLLNAPNHIYVVLKNSTTDTEHYRDAVNSGNEAIYKSMFVVCAIVIIQLLWEAGQAILSNYRKRATSMR